MWICAYVACLVLQITWERARRNFQLWYGGVPRLVLEAPCRQEESEDQIEAEAAIEGIRIEEVCLAVITMS